jgi:D-tyrosyl-tRNA(Tyr) deacylase
MARKLVNMRIFSDQDGKFNHSLAEVGGELLLVSQFTLYGDVTKGNRPSFIQAADPQIAEKLYEYAGSCIEKLGVRVATGRFGAMMKVSLQNDGPVTIIVER